MLSIADGRFVYVLDDAYIHMAIARQLVQHGIWGVTPYEFASASSSPLWTSMLAIVTAAIGPREATAFVMALFSGVLATWAYAREAAALGLAPAAACVVGFVLLLPMAPLVCSGMEPLLQIALTVLLASLSARPLPERMSFARIASYFGLSAALTAVRYEGAFVALGCALLIGARSRRVLPPLAVASGAVIPIAGFGAYSVAHGAAFLPNSILIKAIPVAHGVVELGAAMLRNAWLDIAQAPHLFVVLLSSMVLLALSRADREAGEATGLLFVTVLAGALHLLLAKTGWFYRYEAYLLALWATAAAAVLRAKPRRSSWTRIAGATMLLLVPVTLIPRAVEAAGAVPVATRTIYGQQYQFAHYIRAEHAHATVVANDIGALTFFADVHLVDRWGLGTFAVARAKSNGEDTEPIVARLAMERRATVSITYGSPLPGWIVVARWRVPSPFLAASDTIVFAAPSLQEAASLAARLQRFHPHLPRWVRATIVYRPN